MQAGFCVTEISESSQGPFLVTQMERSPPSAVPESHRSRDCLVVSFAVVSAT